MAKSVEERVEDYFKTQLTKYGIKYFCKTESINPIIDNALKVAESKSGGVGNNFPDIKVLVKTDNQRFIPVMIEAKGTKNKLVRYDKNGNIELERKDGNRNAVMNFAVNGAIHYVNAILNESGYKEALAIGVNGFKSGNELKTECAIFYLSEDNARTPIQLTQYQDLSCLASKNLNKLIADIDTATLTEEQR